MIQLLLGELKNRKEKLDEVCKETIMKKKLRVLCKKFESQTNLVAKNSRNNRNFSLTFYLIRSLVFGEITLLGQYISLFT